MSEQLGVKWCGQDERVIAFCVLFVNTVRDLGKVFGVEADASGGVIGVVSGLGAQIHLGVGGLANNGDRRASASCGSRDKPGRRDIRAPRSKLVYRYVRRG